MTVHTNASVKTVVNEALKARDEMHERVEDRVLRHKERFRSVTKTPKSAETRKRIMTTASDVMMERGNTAFQMSEISRRCGMSKGALYYYFSNKEDLLQAIFEDEVQRLVASIDDAVAYAHSGAEALRGVCHAYAECVCKGGPITMALVRELVISREEVSSNMDSSLMHIIHVVAEQLERAKEEGTVRPDVDAKITSMAVCGAYAFTALAVTADETEEQSTDFAEILYQTIVQGLGHTPHNSTLIS